jgi:hypothetical protein
MSTSDRRNDAGQRPVQLEDGVGGGNPGKRTLTETLQRRAAGAASEGGDSPADVHAIADRGVSGGGGGLPHADRIAASFGRHDVSDVRAHVGGAAADASRALGAQAYATGNDVAFASAPDLHTAAHEAAHVVQQRAGVHLKGGVGEAGDAYERHADAVADEVVAGRSAESLLDALAGPGVGSAGLQCKAVQFWSGHEHRAVGNMAAIIATGSEGFNVNEWVRQNGSRNFQDGYVGEVRGNVASTDPVLADLERRGRDRARIQTNDQVIPGNPRAGTPARTVPSSISFGAANEFGGDYSPTPQDLANQHDSDNPTGNDFLTMVTAAQTNINHFYPLHIAEYRRHHSLALTAAARRDGRTAMQEEGFASHFLADTFAAGHAAPRALDRISTTGLGEDELGLNRSKQWHDALNAAGGEGLPTTRGRFHGDDTMTGRELAVIGQDAGASLKEVLSTLAGNPVPANITIPTPDFGAIQTDPIYGPLWRRMMGDYEQDLREAERRGRRGESMTSDGGTTTTTASIASDMRNTVFGGTRPELTRLGSTEWNGNILVFNLTVDGRPAPASTRVWVQWFDQDMGNDHAMSGHESGTLGSSRGLGANDTDEKIGAPVAISTQDVGVGSARAPVDDSGDVYAIFYSDQTCTVPLGRSHAQGTNRGLVDKPVQCNSFAWSGATLSFAVTERGRPVASRTLYLRWYNEDGSSDRDARGNLAQTVAVSDPTVGGVQTVNVAGGRASITASGSADNSGDTYAVVYLDRGCTIPLGRSPLQP